MRLYEMQDSGYDLWSQDLCSDTINITPQPLGQKRYVFLTSYVNVWGETDKASPKN